MVSLSTFIADHKIHIRNGITSERECIVQLLKYYNIPSFPKNRQQQKFTGEEGGSITIRTAGELDMIVFAIVLGFYIRLESLPKMNLLVQSDTTKNLVRQLTCLLKKTKRRIPN